MPEDSEDVGDEQWYTDEDENEIEENADIYMLAVHDSGIPDISLSPQECRKYVDDLRVAEFWEELPTPEKEKCFQAEVVEGIPNGRIPRAPRTRELVTRDMTVDGLTFKVLVDTGASVSLIPRWAFLRLLEVKGVEFYEGNIVQSELRIRGVTDHLLSSAQEVMLRFDTGPTQADVPCLIDERVEVGQKRGLPLILGSNGLDALGVVLISPQGQLWSTPNCQDLGWSIVRNDGKVLFNGQPCVKGESLSSSSGSRTQGTSSAFETVTTTSSDLLGSQESLVDDEKEEEGVLLPVPPPVLMVSADEEGNLHMMGEEVETAYHFVPLSVLNTVEDMLSVLETTDSMLSVLSPEEGILPSSPMTESLASLSLSSVLRKANDPRPWISQRQKIKRTHKKRVIFPRVRSSLSSPAEQALRRRVRRDIDKRKGPVTAPPTPSRRSVKTKLSFHSMDNLRTRSSDKVCSSSTSSGDSYLQSSSGVGNKRPTLRTLRQKAQRKVYWSPVGRRKMSPKEISEYWRGKSGPFSRIPHYSSPRPRTSTTETDQIRYEATFIRRGSPKVVRKIKVPIIPKSEQNSDMEETVPPSLRTSIRQRISRTWEIVYQGWKQVGRRRGAKKLLASPTPHPLTDSEGWSHGYRFGIRSEAPPRPRVFVSASSLAFTPPPNLASRILDEQRQDPLLQVLFEKTEGFPRPLFETHPMEEFWVRKFGYGCVTKDDILYHYDVSPGKLPESNPAVVPIVPQHLRAAVLHTGHRMNGDHLSTRETLRAIQDKYWWPYMRQDIFYYLDNCAKCARKVRRPFSRLLPLRKPQTVAHLERMQAAGLFKTTPPSCFPGGSEDVTTWRYGDVVYFKPGVRARLAKPLRGPWEFAGLSGNTALIHRIHPWFVQWQQVATHPGNLTTTRIPPGVMGREQKPFPRTIACPKIR